MTKSINLFNNLAETALKERFERPHLDSDEAEILAYCRENCSPLYSQRTAHIILLRRISRIIVDSVLADMSPLSRKIIILKYAKRMKITRIAMECSLSEMRIVSLDHDAREKIRDMLLYTLTARDAYSRSKVANMVHILDLLLVFLEEHPEFAASASRDWVHALELCREKYRRLYTMIEENICGQEKNIRCKVIAVKLQHPLYTLKELSGICHVSQSGICRHLRAFEEKTSEYLMA